MDILLRKEMAYIILNVELEPHMIGRGELCIFDDESSTHIQGSPFHKCYLNTGKISVTSLLACIKVEHWKLLTGILEYL